jgi:hypothetical protein
MNRREPIPPVLRIVRSSPPRPWRQAWRVAYLRVQAERRTGV